MAAQSYNVVFKGYWRDENKAGIPARSGIYCVYACTHNKKENKVSLKKLIYIGESSDVKARIASHNKQEDWEGHLEAGEQLCYTFGAVEEDDRVRCEAAMIFRHEPPENTEYVNNFPFDKTTVNLSGKTQYLQSFFTVDRT